MKKIALCFLVYENIECEEVWLKWFQGNEDKINIYIHSKNNYIPSNSFFKEKSIQIPTVSTTWARLGIVNATINLFKEALTNDENKMFVLLSGNCIPVKSFEYIYSELLSNENRSYSKINEMDIDDGRYELIFNRILKLKNIENPKEIVKKHHQWIIVCKDHVKFICENYNFISELYEDSYYPDECWFLSLMYFYNKQNEVVERYTTFTNWDNAGPHPKTYYEISDEELNNILQNKEHLFARKFTKNTPFLVERLSF
jgi:hypothetical protein